MSWSKRSRSSVPGIKSTRGGKALPAKESLAGAVQGRIGFGAIINSWALSHRSNGRESFARLWAEPLQSLMTVLVIAIAIALPAALWVAVANLQQLSGSWQKSARISVFIDRGATPEVVQGLIATVQDLPQLDTVKYISPDAGLQEFQRVAGFGDALALLDSNPLPGVLLASPDSVLSGDVMRLSGLVDELNQLPGVAEVQLDMQWLQRMQHILEMGERVSVLLGFTLSLGVLLVVGNTIRLAIENRRDEILVVKLVGGTNAFVRRPFLYTGLWYGLSGGLMAWLAVTLAGLWLDSTVTGLAALYQSSFSLAGIGWRGLLVLTTLGGALGLLGAALAVARHIARIEP